jgi:hypothetical protein
MATNVFQIYEFPISPLLKARQVEQQSYDIFYVDLPNDRKECSWLGL